MRRNKKNSEIDEKEKVNLEFEEETSKSIDIVNENNENLRKQRKRRIEGDYEEFINENAKGFEYRKVRPFVIAIMVIIIAVLIYIFFSFGPILGLSINRYKGIDQNKKIDIVTTDDDIYESYCLDLLVYSNQKVTTYNSNCQKNWEYNLAEPFTPKIYIKNKYMVISNNSNGTIYLFENKQEILNKKIDGTIQNIYLDDNGNIAIEYSTTGYKKIVAVFSKNGKNLYNVYLTSESIIDIKLLQNGKKLLIIKSNSQSFKIGITVSIVDGTESESVIKDIAKLDDNFLYDLTIQGQNIIMLLDNKVVKVNIDTGNIVEIKKFDASQLMFIDLSDNYYTFVEKKLDTTADEYAIETSRLDNTIIGNLSIKDSPKIFKNSGLLNYFVFQNKLQVINKWGINIKDINIDLIPKNIVVFNNEKSVGLIYTNKIYIVSM